MKILFESQGESGDLKSFGSGMSQQKVMELENDEIIGTLITALVTK